MDNVSGHIGIRSTDILDLQHKFSEANLRDLQAAYPDEDVETLARFLIGRNNDLKGAKEKLDKMVAWKKDNYPILKQDCLNELRTGKVYVRGEDKQGRPIVVFKTARSRPKQRDLKESVNLCFWSMEQAIQKLPKDKSKFTILVDRTGHKLENNDLELIKTVSALFQDLHPERVAMFIIHPIDLVFHALFSIAKWFVDPVTRNKVRPMLFQSAVHELIDKQHLPVTLGGDDDYEFNANDYPDPYPQEVVQRALMERNLVDAAKVLEEEDTNIKEAQAITHVDATKVLEDTIIKEAQAITHVDATKVLEEEDTNIKEAQAITHVDATKVLEVEDTNIKL